MNNRLTKEEAIDQVFSTVELEEAIRNFESLSDFLDHVTTPTLTKFRWMERTTCTKYASSWQIMDLYRFWKRCP